MNYGTRLYTPPLTPINKLLVYLLASLFLLNAVCTQMLHTPLIPILGLTPGLFFKGHLFQLLSYPFATTGLLNVIFDCLILWYMGSEMEYKFGARGYMRFLLFVTVGTGLFYLGLAGAGIAPWGTPLVGPDSFIFALLLGYAIFHRHQYLSFMLIFPMKAPYFCALLVGIEFYMAIFEPYGFSSWAHLFALVLAALFLKYYGMLPKMGFIDRLQGQLRRLFRSFPLKKTSKGKGKGRKLYLIKNDDNNDKDDDPFEGGPKYWQ